MIPQIFSKTKPVNFLLLSIMLAIYILLYEGFVGISHNNTSFFFKSSVQNISFFLKTMGLLVPSLFLMDFILKRNKLVQTHAYTLLFFVFFTGIFTAVFTNTDLLLSHFFVLMGLRRLISLKTKERTEKKIFECSLWFLLASYFYDWALLYFVALIFGIFFYGKNSFKQWALIPWAAITYVLLLKVFVIGSKLQSFFKNHYVFRLPDQVLDKISLEVILFLSSSLLALLWVFTKSRRVSNTKLGRQSSLNLLFISALVGVFMYLLFPEPSLAPLIFTFFPMAFLWSNLTEELRKTWHKELLLWSAFSIPLWGLLAYLIQN